MVDLIRESACRGYRFKQERQRHGDGPRLFSFHAPEQPLSASAVLFTYEEQPIGWEVDSADVVENLACRLPPIHNTAIRVLYLHAGASTHLQAGRVMGVSESRVGQVHREALRWLRGPIT